MLIQLLTQHPQAALQIVQKTPYWVGGVLAALLALGTSQLFHRTAGLRRVLLMPLVMTGFSLFGLASAFAESAQIGAALGTWLVAAATIAAGALWWQPGVPGATRYEPSTALFHLPGSAVPMALIVGIFLTKYGVGIELALQPALAHDGSFALQIAGLYGAFNGLFAARSLRLWRLWRLAQPDESLALRSTAA